MPPRFTVVLSPSRGAAFARQRAVEMSQEDWIGFLDDDVMPAADWVAQALPFAQQHPQAGAIAVENQHDSSTTDDGEPL